MRGISKRIVLPSYTPVQANVLNKVRSNTNLNDYDYEVISGDLADYVVKNSLSGDLTVKEDLEKLESFLNRKYGIHFLNFTVLNKVKELIPVLR